MGATNKKNNKKVVLKNLAETLITLKTHSIEFQLNHLDTTWNMGLYNLKECYLKIFIDTKKSFFNEDDDIIIIYNFEFIYEHNNNLTIEKLEQFFNSVESTYNFLKRCRHIKLTIDECPKVVYNRTKCII